jgi:hypothetical protein
MLEAQRTLEPISAILVDTHRFSAACVLIDDVMPTDKEARKGITMQINSFKDMYIAERECPDRC